MVLNVVGNFSDAMDFQHIAPRISVLNLGGRHGYFTAPRWPEVTFSQPCQKREVQDQSAGQAMFIRRTRLSRHWSIESNGIRTAYVGADRIKLNVAVAPEFL